MVACAVALSLFIQLFRPEILSAETSSGEEDGSSERRKRRQEKRRRMIENILKGRWQGAALQDPVAVVVPLEVGEELIVLPPPLEALPERLRGVEFPTAWPILAEEVRAWSPPSPVLESVLALPDHLVGAVAAALDSIRPGDGGIVDRLMSVGVENGRASTFNDFFTRLIAKEQSYFAKLEETTVIDSEDPDELIEDQRKLIWDVLRRTYQARYRLRASETLQEDAFDIQGWRGIDLLIVPPLLAGYAMYHGIDRKMSFLGTRMQLSIERFSKWKDDDVPAGVGIEWGPEGWPVMLIVTAGLEDGKFGGDFIGIGTSIGMVRRALALQEVEGYRER
ncbi:MAG TPA: hypothetical protein VF950_00395 [Planctomycetota bacterium]